MLNRTVLVTGGAGYIGSHCVIALLEAGYDVIAVDNFHNSVSTANNESVALKRVEQITGKKVRFYACDLLDITKLDRIFSQHIIDSVIHFAALKGISYAVLTHRQPCLPYLSIFCSVQRLVNRCKYHWCTTRTIWWAL
jgi:UDP-glucose 4-epimerase